MRSNYKKIGKYIKKVNVRNADLKATTLLGINIDKFFMPSVANVVGTDMSTYKIVQKGQFSCNRMHVGRDYRLPISLSTSDEDFLVSPAYDVFEVKNEEELLPEYLMMWFLRKEFDRNSWFYTDADVRGGLHWDAFCDMELPIPSIEKQREIVREYNVVKDRIELNNKLIQKLEETAQAIYKQWFVDFEFPDENGKPYKSSGGEMVWCEELEKDIPKEWEAKKISDLTNCVLGGTPSRYKPEYWNGNINWINSGEINEIRITRASEKITEIGLKKSATKLMPKKTTVIAITGATLGQISILEIDSCANQSVIGILENDNFPYEFIFPAISECLIELLKNQTGGAQPHINKNDVETLKIAYPVVRLTLISDCQRILKPIFSQISEKCFENDFLIETKDLLLSKLATVTN